MKKTVYLRGAYGPGNLGDDVLLLCMINILKNKFCENDIFVGVENVDNAAKIFPNVNFIDYKKPIRTDYFVYGGGGQFFDFEASEKDYDSNIFKKLYYFIRNNKNPYNAFLRICYFNDSRSLEKLVKSNFVASYSIGIGPFETDGKGLSRLKNFERMGDYISFRDSKSIDLFKKTTNTSKNIILSADPSYILSDWYKRSNEINKEKQCTYKYCFIIREWPYSESGKKMIQCMIDTALSYKKEGQKVIIVSLFGTYDHQIIQKSLALGFEVMIYNLVENSISEFLNKLLMESEFIITSRAHGAWLPIVFGKPVLIVGIENKLDQINANLKNCTHITKATNTHNLKESILNFVENYEILKTNIQHDLNPMVNLAENNKESFYEWIESNE